MTAPADLRQYAEHYLRLAQQATSERERALLLSMAQSWNALAEQSERISDLAAKLPKSESGEGPA